MALLSLKETKNMFKNRKAEEGLTLTELLVVIALVAIVAAIAFPIVTNVLSGAQADADTASATNKAKFISDWTAAGANFTTSGGKIYAVINGQTVAQISESTGGAGGGAGGGGDQTATTLSYWNSVVTDAIVENSSFDANYPVSELQGPYSGVGTTAGWSKYVSTSSYTAWQAMNWVDELQAEGKTITYHGDAVQTESEAEPWRNYVYLLVDGTTDGAGTKTYPLTHAGQSELNNWLSTYPNMRYRGTNQVAGADYLVVIPHPSWGGQMTYGFYTQEQAASYLSTWRSEGAVTSTSTYYERTNADGNAERIYKLSGNMNYPGSVATMDLP